MSAPQRADSLTTPPPSEAHHAPPLEQLRELLLREPGDLGVVFGYLATIGLLGLVFPVAVQVLVNQVAFTVLLQPVALMTLFVLLGWGLSAVLRVLQVRVVERLQQRLSVRTAADLAVRLQRAQVTAFERAHGSEIVRRFLDIVTLRKSCAGLLLDGLGIVVQGAMGLLVLAFYHPMLLAFAFALIGCILLVPRGPHRHVRVGLRQTDGSLALQAVGSAALLGLGGALVIAGQLTIGQLVAAEIIVSSGVAGIAKLGKHLEASVMARSPI